VGDAALRQTHRDSAYPGLTTAPVEAALAPMRWLEAKAFLVQDEALAQQPRQVPRERHESGCPAAVLRHGHAPGAGFQHRVHAGEDVAQACR